MRYFALHVPVPITCSASNLAALKYAVSKHGLRTLTADFLTDEDHTLLRVSFGEAIMFRVLDEMPLSTEGDEGWEGHVPDHLAYRVEGTVFWSAQSEPFRFSYASARHFRFITGLTCLDLVAEDQPRIEVVSD